MNTDNRGLESKNNSLKDEFCVWGDGGSASGEYDVSEEYVLPDYYPDIRKILLVKASLEGGDSYVGDGRWENGGEIAFKIIYLGDTGEIKCVPLSYPYTNTLLLEGVYEDSVINETNSVKSKSVRALSQRKLLIKAKILSEISIRNKLCVSPRLVGGSGVEDEFSLERRVRSVSCASYIKFEEGDIRLSEDIEYRGRSPLSEIIYHDCRLFTRSCRYVDGRLDITGVALICCLVSRIGDGGETVYEVIEKSIPIEHTSEVRLPFTDGECFAKLEAVAFECALANDSLGESRVIEADVAAVAKVTAIANGESVFTDDVFSVLYDYSNTYKTVETERLVKCGCENFSVSAVSELPKGEGATVLMATADAAMSLSDSQGDKLIFTGDCNVKCIISDNDNGFGLHEFTFPVKYECRGEVTGECLCTCDCTVLDARASAEGGKLSFNGEIGVNYAVSEKVFADTVTQINIDKNSPLPNDREGMTVLYYPEKTETLWDVAKKYGVQRAALEKVNGKQLVDGLPRVLIIPERK